MYIYTDIRPKVCMHRTSCIHHIKYILNVPYVHTTILQGYFVHFTSFVKYKLYIFFDMYIEHCSTMFGKCTSYEVNKRLISNAICRGGRK